MPPIPRRVGIFARGSSCSYQAVFGLGGADAGGSSFITRLFAETTCSLTPPPPPVRDLPNDSWSPTFIRWGCLLACRSAQGQLPCTHPVS